MYILLFAQAMCMYCRFIAMLARRDNFDSGKLLKKRAHILYIYSLALLWVLTTSGWIIEWVRSRRGFVVNNSSPEAILESMEVYPVIEGGVLLSVTSAVSDGILVTTLSLF